MARRPNAYAQLIQEGGSTPPQEDTPPAENGKTVKPQSGKTAKSGKTVKITIYPVSDHRGSNSQPIDFEGVKIYPIFMAKIENTEKSGT
jgi:hypothetical protein